MCVCMHADYWTNWFGCEANGAAAGCWDSDRTMLCTYIRTRTVPIPPLSPPITWPEAKKAVVGALLLSPVCTKSLDSKCQHHPICFASHFDDYNQRCNQRITCTFTSILSFSSSVEQRLVSDICLRTREAIEDQRQTEIYCTKCLEDSDVMCWWSHVVRGFDI
jgi:hypothetical protein